MYLLSTSGQLGIFLFGMVMFTGCASVPSGSPQTHKPAPGISAPVPPKLPPPEIQARESAQPQTLEEMIRQGIAANSRLRSLAAQVEAAWAKAPQARSLPDPVLSTVIYGHPVETAAGSLRANVTLSQKLPWWKRLKAQEQKAALEAAAIQETLKAEQLRLVADIKTAYYRIYLLNQQIRITKENKETLESIIRVELARAGTAGTKTAVNDTLQSSVELSRLDQALIELKQRKVKLQAGLNALLNRDAKAPLTIPIETDIPSDFRAPANLLALAEQYQPELVGMALKADAAQAGVEIAHLLHIPDVTLSAGWTAIEDNRPPSRIVDVGADAWSVGVSINLPIWKEKYASARQEARAAHASSIAMIEDVRRRYDALLTDLAEQAKAASETVRLYDKAILPQAKSVLRTDRRSYGSGNVDFDRLMNNFRNLLNLEINSFRAKAQLAIARARLEQAVGLPWEKITKPPTSEKKQEKQHERKTNQKE